MLVPSSAYRVDAVHDGVKPDELVLLDEMIKDRDDVVEQVDEQPLVGAFLNDDVETVDLDDGQCDALLMLSPAHATKTCIETGLKGATFTFADSVYA